jgi:hypothetical protein
MAHQSIGMFDLFIPNANVSRLDLKAMPNGADRLFVHCQKHHFDALMITAEGPIIPDLKKYPPNQLTGISMHSYFSLPSDHEFMIRKAYGIWMEREGQTYLP